MASLINEVVIDCHDPQRVAAFWAAALTWKAQQDGEIWWMSESGNEADAGMALVFIKVPEPKTVKNRVHLDLSPFRCDQDEEVARLLALGATHADIGQGDVAWVVLADPEGNEFCVLRRRRD